jgi:hypothetical protein
MLEGAREKWGGLLAALAAIGLGMIGVVSGQFWIPRARRTVQGDGARILGGITLAFGAVLLIGWVLAVAGGEPDSSDPARPAPRRLARKRKPRPIDPAERIAAEALDLDGEGIEGARPPSAP